MYKHLITDFPKMTNYMNRDEKKLLDLKKQKDINSYIDIENMINIFSHHHILNFNIEVMFCEFENQKEKKNYILSFKLIKIQNDEFFYFSLKEPKENINITLENQKKYEEFNLRLLSSYSHELKTPINGAIPSLEILQNDLNFNKENKNKKQLKLIMTSLKILQNSIDNIFDYSSFSNNQFYLNKKSFFLINLINEISEIIESKIDNIKVKYVQIIDPYILNKKIFNDYSRLRQLLLNLLLNSIQFTLNGTIKLKINFKNSKTIDFTVEDTGIGINQHRLQQILDKITCDQYLNIESTSSCLGLIISQKLACLLGNNEGLKIESKLGSGSLFNFNISNNENFHHSIDLTKNACNSKSSLKFDEVIQNSIQNSFIITKKSLEIKENFNKEFCTHQNFDKSNEIIQAQKEKYVSNSLKRISHKRHSILSANHINEEKQQISELSLNLVIESKLETDNDCDCAKILIVDDDMFNLMVLERLLNTLKFKCLKATNGKDAIDLLSSQKCLKCKGIKLIFMDYQMPIMDGIEATVQINKLIEDKIINYVVIIGCTAFTSKDYVLKCYEVGMKTVIFKPLNINIIKETLDQWLLDK